MNSSYTNKSLLDKAIKIELYIIIKTQCTKRTQ